MKNKGFSLVEMIVVIAIMAVLMSVLAPVMLRYIEKTRIQRDDSAAAEVRNALELALADETTFKALAGRDVVVKITGTTGVITVTSPTTDPHDAILSEICLTVNADSANKIEIASADRKEKIYAVKAVSTATDNGYRLTKGAWSADGSAVE